ncbi:unnamed protein product, partial [Candidula unifasciata]
WQWEPKDRPTFKEIVFLLENMFDKSSINEGPTPPAGRRVLSVLEEADITAAKMSEALYRKSSRKKSGKSAPLPPRGGDIDMELKNRIRLQKAKLESSSFVEEGEFVDSGLGMDSAHRGFSYSSYNSSIPPALKAQGGQISSPTFLREDKASKASVDNLKAAQIDRSKYLISEANARTFEKHAPERSSTRSMDTRAGERLDGSQDMGFIVSGQYNKKAVLPPQRSAMLPRKKLSEHSLPHELSHSVSVDETDLDSTPRVGKLDVTNVTKAINRYGTIPKGVRIGAYLESMEREQESHGHELSAVDDHDSGTDSASVTSCPALGGDHSIEAGPGVSLGLAVKRVEGFSEDSDPGIKQEPNLKPSAFVKSQSQHGLGDGAPTAGSHQHQGVQTSSSTNVKSQYSGLLQRHKSDLSSSSKPSTPSELFTSSDQMITSTTSSGYQHPTSVHRSDTDPLSHLVDHSPPQPAPPHSAPPITSHFPDLCGINKPKPSPRFSRQYGDGLGVQDQPQLQIRPPLAAVPANNLATDCSVLNSSESYKPPAWMVGLKSRSEDNHQQSNGTPSNVSSFKIYTKPSVNINSHLEQKHQQSPALRETSIDQVNSGSFATSAEPASSGRSETVAYRSTGVKLLPTTPGGGPLLESISMSGSYISDPQQTPSPAGDGVGGQSNCTEPVNIDCIKSASDRLNSCIDKLAQAGNKSSTNFMLLSEEVLAFYGLCSRYIDALPPHAKFHARELLTRMQAHSQNLKTYTSTSPSGGSKLLDDIQSTNKEIMTVIQR